jgi:hypothetical protein
MTTETIYTDFGDTVILTKQEDGMVNLLVFDEHRGRAVELPLSPADMERLLADMQSVRDAE